MPKLGYTDKQKESLFKGIYSGAINEYNLPKNLYKSTAIVLNDGVESEFGKRDTGMLKEFKNNIYMFSAAKTFHQVLEMQTFMSLDYAEFKKKVDNTFETYNKAYLDSEYTTAVTSANNALNYRDAINDSDLFTQLKYVAIIDKHTSDICRQLDGTIANTTDTFWHTHTPPNHFNCRCHVEKIDKYSEVKPFGPKRLEIIAEDVDQLIHPSFKNNSGITEKAFTKEHPYFRVPKKYKSWAEKNFGLPIPE